MSDEIKFYAAMPNIQGAIRIGGDEHDGSRIVLESPGTEIAEIVKLLRLRGRTLRVTIEPE